MLEDELDIYDDLDQFQEAETKKCKELEAWEAKYDAARLEIDNLQAEKKALAKKIRTMEVNFQNLLDTARAEIKRKDAQIIQLRKEKDDICFRRKQVPKLGLPMSQIPPAPDLQHHQAKHFKRDEVTEKTENEIAFNNKNENCDAKAKQHVKPEAKRQQAASSIDQDDKERKTQDKRYKALRYNATAKVAWSADVRSTHDRDHEKPRERDRHRDRGRERSRRRSHSRSRSRSRTRTRTRSREHDRSQSQKHRSRSKEQRRKRSRSRSRSHSRLLSHSTNKASSKNSKRNSSRETERGHDAKSTTHNKRSKLETMEALFGSTSTQNSPAAQSNGDNNSVDIEKVMEKLIVNADPLTPKELYTPQSQTDAREVQVTTEQSGTEMNQLVEYIDSYFESNFQKKESPQVVERNEDREKPGIIVHKQHPFLSEGESNSVDGAAESKMDAVELVNEKDREPNKDATEHENENGAEKNPSPHQEPIIEEEKPHSPEMLDDIIVMDAAIHSTYQHIPGLDFISGEQSRDFDTDNAMDSAQIPGLDLINSEEELNNAQIGPHFELNSKNDEIEREFNEMEKAQTTEHIELNLKNNEIMDIIERSEQGGASGLDVGDHQEFTDINKVQDLNYEEVGMAEVDMTSHENKAGLEMRTEETALKVDAKEQKLIAEMNLSKDGKVNKNKKKKRKRGKASLNNKLRHNAANDAMSTSESVSNQASQTDLKIVMELNSEEGVKKEVETETRENNSYINLSGETELTYDEEMPNLILAADEELTNEITDNKIIEKSVNNQEKEVHVIATADVESNDADNEDFILTEQLKTNTNEPLSTDKTKITEITEANASRGDNLLEQAMNECHHESQHNEETIIQFMVSKPESQEPSLRQSPYMSLAEDNLRTPKRPVRMESIEIIEDIRLPIKMDIENIAIKVDGSNAEQTEEFNLNMGKAATAASELEESQLKFIAVNQKESELATTPKQTVVATTVMYAQPDSTKVDHSEDDATLEAVMNELIPDKSQATSLESYPNLSLETDTIEMALKQLHQHTSCQSEPQPDETAVTSTSMKGGQTPKQDLIQILMQSPLQQTAAHSPAKLKNGLKKVGARTTSEWITPSREDVDSVTPNQREQTPLKKRKVDLNNEHIINTADPSITPTPPVGTPVAAEPSQLNVTIDETFDASSLDHSQNLNSSDSILVTKRCSLGNSDYQFERFNDEVVLRVTRRRRRRPAAATTIEETNTI